MNCRSLPKIKVSVLVLGLCYLLLMSATTPLRLCAQEDFNRTIITDLTNKTAVSFEPEASSSSGKTVATGFGNFRQLTQPTGENRVVRLLMDETNAVIFGYELTVEQTASNKFRLKLAPLPANFVLPTFAGQKASLAGNRRKTILLTLPETISDQAVDDADELTVNLLFHPQLKIRIADRIRVSAVRGRLSPPPIVVPRELTVDDLELALKNLRVKVNEAEFAKSKNSRSYTGSLIWFYVPQKGFFLLSLAPREGYDFRRIGTVSNNKIVFRSDGENYELISEEPILPVTGTWGLWVLHDPRYRPPFLAPIDETDQTAIIEPPKPEKPPKIKKDAYNDSEKPDKKAAAKKNASDQSKVNVPLVVRDVQIGTTTKIENILPRN